MRYQVTVVTLVIGTLLALPVVCSAQAQRIELTPTLGWGWGGDIRIEERAFRHQDYDVQLDNDGSFGLVLDIPLSPTVAFELLATRQDTQLNDSQGLFGEEPSAFVPEGTRRLVRFDVSHFHAGLLINLGQGDYQPYVVASAGISLLEPAVPLDSDQAFSFALGGGLKMRVSERLALRFESRFFFVDTDQSESAVQYLDHVDCTGDCTYTYYYNDDMLKTELSFGLAIRL